eukprot:scaffold299818_cov21-Tisochrysis_lutea.AAC.1
MQSANVVYGSTHNACTKWESTQPARAGAHGCTVYKDEPPAVRHMVIFWGHGKQYHNGMLKDALSSLLRAGIALLSCTHIFHESTHLTAGAIAVAKAACKRSKLLVMHIKKRTDANKNHVSVGVLLNASSFVKDLPYALRAEPSICAVNFRGLTEVPIAHKFGDCVAALFINEQ